MLRVFWDAHGDVVDMAETVRQLLAQVDDLHTVIALSSSVHLSCAVQININ
jgi:hypothetical protein